MKKAFTFLVFCCLALAAASQTKNPDTLYFREIAAIQKIISVREIRESTDTAHVLRMLDSAVSAYLRLAGTYRLTCGDAKSLAAKSILIGRPDGYSAGVRRLMHLLGHSVDQITGNETGFASQSYRKAIPDIQARPAMAAAYRELLSGEHRLLSEAKKHMDWQAVLLIEAISASDFEFRVFAQEHLFKDSSQFPPAKHKSMSQVPRGKMMGMNTLDSLHFHQLYAYIRRNGFPGESRTGCYCSKLWPIFRHSIGLLSSEGPAKEEYVRMWRYLLPVLYKETLNGEYPIGWYQYVYEDLSSYAAKWTDKEISDYIKGYRIDY